MSSHNIEAVYTIFNIFNCDTMLGRDSNQSPTQLRVEALRDTPLSRVMFVRYYLLEKVSYTNTHCKINQNFIWKIFGILLFIIFGAHFTSPLPLHLISFGCKAT